MSKTYLDINDNPITKQEFLYGKDVHVEPIPQNIIEDRVEDLNIHLAKLLEKDYREREQTRINKIVDEIKFWQNINE